MLCLRCIQYEYALFTRAAVRRYRRGYDDWRPLGGAGAGSSQSPDQGANGLGEYMEMPARPTMEVAPSRYH